ncbi:MAG: LytTR family DNA-binding domain-containing protein [Gammaproteobacteria bacterium]|uniref:LytR/AlgR family response regulator transcription factor n=1 Tax=Aquabacterium sp. UBA2148 TaxID=1946042 RepID=UPI001DDA54EF|nr:LytTR family DNA-binding domain-containing protein [Aquabacterium sp. UBA2148]MBU0915016.1 LytTR family DNA-binding domain-containing protein [Gammaproteobacteria bacterium]
MNALALIAEDEPLLAEALARKLQRLWPELQLLPAAPDGQAAIDAALEGLPDILFLDIQMPDVTGLDAADVILERWPDDRPLPLIVFVTAYDHYALAAFEHAAVDYVLKPVQSARLGTTVTRLQAQLSWRQQGGGEAETQSPVSADHPGLPNLSEDADGAMGRPTLHRPEPLTIIQVAAGQTLVMVPVEDILCFEAADKYVRLVTDRAGSSELLIRTPLRELLPRLDANRFWQVHRSAVVNVTAIDRVIRDGGKLRIHIRGRAETLEVSRMYAHRFKAM